MNQKLYYLLIFKITLTLAMWCIPLMLFPAELLEWLGFPSIEPSLFSKLLGMAYLALVVGYTFGLLAVRNGETPINTIWVGIVSNGGAAIILGFYGLQGAWSEWGWFAQLHMWLSFIGVTIITFGLFIFGLFNKVNNR
ncbi:MAG: hypothetical protein MI867_25365 [Pseudomonadales bacterium]|nr:hypothetical protein [Pseudomonadales bacterium]